MLVYEISSSFTIGNYRENSSKNKFKAIVFSYSQSYLIWYIPDHPDKIRPVIERDLEKIAKYIKKPGYKIDRECKDFLKELIEEYYANL